jgi:hypothetical protein
MHGRNRLTPQEIILHALHENGQIQTHDLEEHIKDDIEREGSKIAEMARKMRQGYKEVVSCARRVIRSFPLTSRQLHPSSRTICYSTRTRECSWSELTTSHEKV